MEAKPEKPINELPSPNANAYPMSQKDNPPGRKEPADHKGNMGALRPSCDYRLTCCWYCIIDPFLLVANCTIYKRYERFLRDEVMCHKHRSQLRACNAFTVKQQNMINIPKQRSEKFLIRMLMVFLALTEPASRNAKPACMKRITVPMSMRKRWSIFSEMAVSWSSSVLVVVLPPSW